MGIPQFSMSNPISAMGAKVRAQWMTGLSAALNDASPPVARTLAGALDALANALDALPQVDAQIGLLMSDTRYSVSHKIEQATALLTQATDQANAAADAAEQAGEAAKTALRAQLMPAKPSGADSAQIIERKHDLQHLIKQRGGGDAHRMMLAARDLVTAALDGGDQLTAYVLTSEMDLVYQAWGIDALGVAQITAAATARGANRGADATAQAALLAMLQRGGEATYGGTIQTVRFVTHQHDQDMRAYLAGMASSGVMLNNSQGQ